MENCKIIQGLMRVNSLSDEELYELIKFDIANGIKMFDLADIYDDGEVELKLGRILEAHPELREKMIIQTKCGIRRSDVYNSKYYDLSYDHIINSVNDSLKRLNVDYIDVLLLHRPDIFLESNEIARALSTLQHSGKVLHFGVSNFPHEAVKYISDQTNIPITINQLQLGLGHMELVNEVLNTNMNNNEGSMKTSELYFYMKRHGFTIQARSPFQYKFFEGSIFDDEKYKELNKTLNYLAKKYDVSKCAIATAFILKLGDNVELVSGATKKNTWKNV